LLSERINGRPAFHHAQSRLRPRRGLLKMVNQRRKLLDI
jgi:ribosomal protein S15P/S13E